MPIGHASPTHPARLAHLSIAQMNVHEVELLRIPPDPPMRVEMVNKTLTSEKKGDNEQKYEQRQNDRE